MTPLGTRRSPTNPEKRRRLGASQPPSPRSRESKRALRPGQAWRDFTGLWPPGQGPPRRTGNPPPWRELGHNSIPLDISTYRIRALATEEARIRDTGSRQLDTPRTNPSRPPSNFARSASFQSASPDSQGSAHSLHLRPHEENACLPRRPRAERQRKRPGPRVRGESLPQPRRQQRSEARADR